MMNEISLLKSNDYREITTNEILKEADEKNRFIMNLCIKKQSERPIYRLCENGESSKISFFKYANFPDGIYFEISADRKIVFHVIEQKKAPTKDYKKLSKQLISGYVHAKSLSTILNVPEDSIKINYYITYLEDPDETVRYNGMDGRAPRMILGENFPPEHTFSLWKRSLVVYKNDLYSKAFNINKIKMVNPTIIEGVSCYQNQLLI